MSGATNNTSPIFEQALSLSTHTHKHTHTSKQCLIKNAAKVQLVILTVCNYLCALLIYNEDWPQWNWWRHKNSGCITLLLIPYRLSLVTHVIESIISVLVFQFLKHTQAHTRTQAHTHTSSPSILSSSDHFAVSTFQSWRVWAVISVINGLLRPTRVCPSGSALQYPTTACSAHTHRPHARSHTNT